MQMKSYKPGKRQFYANDSELLLGCHFACHREHERWQNNTSEDLEQQRIGPGCRIGFCAEMVDWVSVQVT